jgi:hypothetical protein
MPKRVVSVPRTPASLDIVSYGRRGPSSARQLTQAQIEQVARTVRKTPEVVVKVSGGARDAAGAKAHFDYIDRHGKLALETDDGRNLTGKGVGSELAAEWNLDLSRGQYRPKPVEGAKDTRPKVVHNIVLSMPGPTPPEAVLAAARKFARENFALQYRYGMVLHTDQGHPHVHLVVKAEHEYEPGKRLYIRKATLRLWREQFAAYLREQGVAANATPAALRGKASTRKKDPIHRRLMSLAAHDGLAAEVKAKRRPPIESTFMRSKVQAVANELRGGYLRPEPGKAKLIEIRRGVASDWLTTAAVLWAQGNSRLAQEVKEFVKAMPPVRTEKEQIAASLLSQIQARRQGRADLEPQASLNKRGE